MKTNRVNEKIRAQEVMVIDSDGTKLGNLKIGEAVGIAKNKSLDLVEVSPHSSPPVCKIMDFGKFKYKASKKDHDSKKKQKTMRLKEVKMTPTIGSHDYNFKLDHIKKFIGEGDKVKLSIVFRGRMIVHQDMGFAVINRVIEDTIEVATLEQSAPKKEGRDLFITLIPKKTI